MKTISIAFSAIFLWLNTTLPALAWSSPGHIIVASIAYRDLSDSDKKQVDQLLTHHPDCSSWKAAYQTSMPFDLEAFIFMRASTWPDEIRRSGNQYDHPNWHFIDYPLTPTKFKFKNAPDHNNDVLYGISQCEEMLQDSDASDEVRAIYLSWLIHLVGDIHQPLHCASLFTSEYPEGDRGGNSFFIRPASKGVKLHAVWDQSLGSSVNFRSQYNYATQLCSDHARGSLSELGPATTPLAWSKESRKIAVESGYLKGNLKGSKTSGGSVAPPSDYTANVKTISERQAALAGYRLADLIAASLQ